MKHPAVVLPVCLLCLSGCATRVPFENYPAGSLSEQQVAIVRVGLIKRIVDEAGNVLLDLSRYEYAEHPEYRLKPGKYWVQFDYWGMPHHSPEDATLFYQGKVEFQAGHRYEVKHEDCNIYFDMARASCRENGYKSYMWLEDTVTGEVLIR